MRLINADILNNAIESDFDRVCVYDVEPYEAFVDFQRLVDEQPTAYDVDKVCEELKFATRKGTLRACDFTGILGTEDYKGAFVSTQQAIDIVRRGGLND